MFVQVIEAKAKDADALCAQMEAWERDVKPGAQGFLGSTAGVSEDGTFMAAARFESEEAARRNSDRAEQGQWWKQTAQHLDEPKFYDCRDVDVFMSGGSDDAGFVQVIQGYATDKSRLRELMTSMSDELTQRRPDVIGGLVAWGPDDGFSDFVYFTSETEAREAEKQGTEAREDPSGDAWDQLVRDVKFLDLKDPWFTSP